MTSYTAIDVDTLGNGVTRVTLNRPEVRNALNTEMGWDVVHFFESAAMGEVDARCIILTGSGDKAFCAGGDLKERRGMTDQEWMAQHVVFERMARALVDCPIPLIAAVNGAAFGGGCEIAAACDFIYAADTARFALTEVTLGIMPGAGGTQTLSRAVGERRAMELILSGRPFTAGEAHQWGLVNSVLPAAELPSAVAGVATQIADNAPMAVRQAKQAIRRGLQISLHDALAFEIQAYNFLVPSEDRHEGVAAFNEKRSPVFKGR